MGFCAPPGKVFLSVDFSSQELLLAAALSKDPVMVRSFKEPLTITLPDGTVYDNPHADLHTMSTVGAVAPDLFKFQPESEWVRIAKKSGKRQYGKVLNFSILYLATAITIAQRNHVKVEEAELWVKGHENTYAGYHAWANEFGNWAVARGYAVSPVTNLWRYTDEENAKGSGESPLRSAVNHSIQSICAQICKESLIQVRKLIKGSQCKILGVVHDKVLSF
jgi:DNA polymerase-1